jgi:hypothetical protein
MKKQVNQYKLIYYFFVLIFLIIKITNIRFKFSDENTYFYMAKLILNGNLPYRDFFFASPPLQIYLIALFMLFIKENYILLKLIPVISSIITSKFLFLIVKNRFNIKNALYSSIFYLFSSVVLLTSDHSTGIHLTVMFLLISIFLINKKKYVFAGIFCSFAILTRLYALFVFAGIFIYLFYRKKKESIKFLFSNFFIIMLVSLFFMIISNGTFIDNILFFRFNLIKITGIPKLRILKFFIKSDFLIVLFLIFYLIKTKKSKIIIFYSILIFLMIFYIVYQDLYYLYLGLIIPFLSIFSALGLDSLTKKIKSKNFRFLFLFVIFLFIILFSSLNYFLNHASASEIYFLNDITSYIKENSKPDETIYGNFEVTPLVALISNRKIINNYADTNDKNFITNRIKINKITKELNKVKFIVLKGIIKSNGEFRQDYEIVENKFLLENCKIKNKYILKKDYSSNIVILFDCNSD